MRESRGMFGRALVVAGLWVQLVGCEKASEKEEPSKEVTPPAAPAPIAEEKTAPESAEPGSLRLVIVGPGEPLGSEKSQIDELSAALKKAKLKIDTTEASDAERQAMADLASEKPVQVDGWGKFETVVLLEMVKPEGTEKGKRISRGRGHAFILHPPEKEPAYATIYETNDKGAWLEGGKFGAWIATHLRYRNGEAGEDPKPEKHEPVAQKEAE